VNGAELYFLGRRLTQIAVAALADDSYLRRVTPGARLVLEDGASHPGTTAGEIAGRTGLQRAQVSALLEDLFTGGWRVDAIDPATIEVTFDPAGVSAWRTSLTRL
jgi:DNA-binding MarR family transcriptional regulator